MSDEPSRPAYDRTTVPPPSPDDGGDEVRRVKIALDEAEIPKQIGPYQIISLISDAGGMGMVYLAEQREPVRRQVALKLIKFGMDTKEFLARFEAERQALALMEDPNI